MENNLGKTTPSSPDRDSNLDLPVLGSPAQQETSALANYATKDIEAPSPVLRHASVNVVEMKNCEERVPKPVVTIHMICGERKGQQLFKIFWCKCVVYNRTVHTMHVCQFRERVISLHVNRQQCNAVLLQLEPSCVSREGVGVGDFGGPLIVRMGENVKQIGTASWGDFAEKDTFTCFYADISQYRLWIHQKTQI
ncbi:unnamed protein product [Timema podura]|uniref:Peptidase S1 domain-containing protein n=1 Tax=Timema podura TaxID=61482 RepID=A0ABN7P3N9_TIMPD|nr:unnamed protein product [Timema podura]